MFFTERWRVVCCFIVLGLYFIIWLDVRLGLILWLVRAFVAESSEGFCHIP